MTTNLLIKEPPLQVLPSLAYAIGLNEALVLQQLHYWLENKNTKGIVIDGHKYILNTYTEWEDNFPFWSGITIKRIFLSLEKQDLVISIQPNKKQHDHTKAYRIDYDTLDRIKLIPSNVSNRYDVNRNPETTTKTSRVKGAGAKTEKKGDLIDAYLRFMPGAKKSVRLEEIHSAINVTFSIRASYNKWETFIRYIDEMEQKNDWHFDDFAAWLKQKPKFDVSFWPPEKMMEVYQQAFIEPEKKTIPNGNRRTTSQTFDLIDNVLGD